MTISIADNSFLRGRFLRSILLFVAGAACIVGQGKVASADPLATDPAGPAALPPPPADAPPPPPGETAPPPPAAKKPPYSIPWQLRSAAAANVIRSDTV